MILEEHTIGCQQHRHQPHFTSWDQLHGLYNIIGHNQNSISNWYYSISLQVGEVYIN